MGRVAIAMAVFFMLAGCAGQQMKNEGPGPMAGQSLAKHSAAEPEKVRLRGEVDEGCY